ncbi:MAG TPA: hypothetical protein VGL56_03745 [Fimbriimonadaceae bacterium]|jgi:hypothetical protein
MKRFETTDDMRPEYDLSTLLVVARGPQRRVTVTLASDVAEFFKSEESVNEALRNLIRLSVSPASSTPKPVRKLPKPKKSA